LGCENNGVERKKKLFVVGGCLFIQRFSSAVVLGLSIERFSAAVFLSLSIERFSAAVFLSLSKDGRR
jgi:hypothetical protein